MDPLGRRASARIEVALEATVTVNDVEHHCVISNLSLGGALVTGIPGVAMGERIGVRFVVPDSTETVDVAATVRWRTSGETGLQFDGLRAREVWALNQLFKVLQRAAS